MTPRQLEKLLATKLQSFISEPEVTVIVTKIKSQKYNVLGMVSKPGSYPLTNSVNGLGRNCTGRGVPRFCQAEIDLYPSREPGRRGVAFTL